MLEILNNDGFPPPIIVFVNQKKTADMVCKDIQRGGVRTCSLKLREGYHCIYIYFASISFIHFTVASHHVAFRQESRATRSSVTSATERRIRCVGCD